MSKLKHLMSYFYPVVVDVKRGDLNQQHLEVRKSNGKFMLDSTTANYSYGGLQKLMDTLFYQINIKQYNLNNVLVLGMGAGSIISLLTEKYKKKCKITAVEKDAVVIELAKKYFNIQRFKSLRIIQADAFQFVAEETEKYDLVIIDLFINDEVPKQFASPEFIANLKKLTAHNCCVIYNKMTDKSSHKKEFEELVLNFEIFFPGLQIHKLIANSSENSFICYNTLPSIVPAPDATKQVILQEELTWPNLKPELIYNKTKSK